MTRDEAIQVAIDFIVGYSEMRQICKGRTICNGCVYRPYLLCDIMEPGEAIDLVGSYLIPFRTIT